MKNLLTSLVLIGSVSIAQANTEAAATQAATTAPAANQQQAQAPAAKAMKKQAKKAKKATAAQAAAASAPAADQQATEQNTQAAPANTTAAPAPAAATSTATVAPAAPAKKWGVTLLNESSIDNEGRKDLSNAVVSTVNYVGASYKITATEKVGVRQYYTYDYNPNSEKEFETSDINQSFTVATISTKTKGILGSDDIAPMFWYYMPGHTAEETNFKKDMDHFYGVLRADVEANWTLNPKWSVSYYMNPRQTLGAKDEEAKFEATTRLIHYGNVYYNVSDETQLYFNAGFDHKVASRNMTSTSDYYTSAVGASFSFFGGKLNLNPEINTYIPLKTGGKSVAAPKYYQSEDIGYTLATVIAL